MKFFSILAGITAATAATVQVSWDSTYDNKAGALTSVACSDGVNGLITKYVTADAQLRRHLY